jgi:hypothetical protein
VGEPPDDSAEAPVASSLLSALERSRCKIDNAREDLLRLCLVIQERLVGKSLEYVEFDHLPSRAKLRHSLVSPSFSNTFSYARVHIYREAAFNDPRLMVCMRES